MERARKSVMASKTLRERAKKLKSRRVDHRNRSTIVRKILDRFNTEPVLTNARNSKRKAPTQIGNPAKWIRDDIVPRLVKQARTAQEKNKMKRQEKLMARSKGKEKEIRGAIAKKTLKRLSDKYKKLGTLIRKSDG